MKNTKKNIIDRFKKFDFDPQEINQKEIFNKVMNAPAKGKSPKRSGRLVFAFVAVFSVLIAVVLVNDKKETVKSDLYVDTETVNDFLPAQEHDAQEAESKEAEFIYEDGQKRHKAAVSPKDTEIPLKINVVAMDGEKEISLENAYIWIDNKLSGKTDGKGDWTKKVNAGKIKGMIVVRDYDKKVFEQDISAGKDATIKVVMEPEAIMEQEMSGYASIPAPEGTLSRNVPKRAAPTDGYSSRTQENKASQEIRMNREKEHKAKASYSSVSRSAQASAGVKSVTRSASSRVMKGAKSSGQVYSGISAPPQENYSGGRSYAEYDYNSMRDESYKKYEENSFRSTVSDPLSTFSADVDAASYNIVRQSIMDDGRPNPDSVRIEEFLNYFDYSYPQPEGDDPVSINFEYTDSPWNKGHKLVKIGIKAKDIAKEDLPASNLVFLIDVSGSMAQQNRLPLVKKSMQMLVNELRSEDKVSIVTYANGVNEILSGAKGREKERIISAINNLHAAGGTNGSEGLALAYETAKKNFIRKGNNRVILATDGDFNIGPRYESELENQITEARDSGVFLSVLGYGMGNYKDSKMQTLANKGNGNYAYINDLLEAKKVLVKEFGGTLFTVAKDVKLQVEFNPAFVAAYRLVGYEKRALNTQDFNDDAKDAGEIGSGHTVTVLYEIIPAGVKSAFLPDVETLKYTKVAADSDGGDILTLKLRYKEPDSDISKMMAKTLEVKEYVPFNRASDDMRFAASVAQFGQILKNSRYKGDMTIDEVINTAKKAKGSDEEGYRTDFVRTAEMYKMLANESNGRSGTQNEDSRIDNTGIAVCPNCGYINTVRKGKKPSFCLNCKKTLK